MHIYSENIDLIVVSTHMQLNVSISFSIKWN